jgi:glucuronide carrier protein
VSARAIAPSEPHRARRPAPLRRSQYLGYGAGDAANNLAFSMTSMFLLIYYTDVVGLSAAAVGTMFLIVRFWDAFADVFAGRVVDRTQTRWGKFRPFLLFASLPLLLVTVAVFSVPGGLSDGGALVYAYVSYAVFGLIYSLVNIPYGSMATAMTQRSEERAKLATFRVFGTNLTILMLALVVAPQIKGSDDLQRSLTVSTLAFAAIGFALYLFTFFTATEQVERDVPKVSARQTIDTVKHNKPLLMLCLSSLVFLIGMFALQTVGIYYARDVLGNANYYVLLIVVQTAGMLLAAAFVPHFVRTIGKKRAYLSFGAIAIVAGIGLAVAPSSAPIVAFCCFFVVGIGVSGVNTLMWALEADTVEYGEWKTGIRTEGTTYALFSFTRKMGQAVGGAAAAYTIGFGGYIAQSASQPDSAITAIKIAAGVVPAVVIGVALAIMFAYPLTESRFREMVREVAQRRVARQVEAARTSPAPVPATTPGGRT